MKYQITETILIKKNKSSIYDFLSDLKNWNSWSPWTIFEPACNIDLSDQQANTYRKMAWSGKIIGAGEITIINHSTNTDKNRIEYSLDFIKPFKSHAQVFFEVKEEPSSPTDTSKVTWIMHSQLPIYLFFLRPIFKKMLSSDYQRGLFRLKTLLENGKIDAQLTFNDKPQTIPSFNLIAKGNEAHLNDLPEVMAQDFTHLKKYLSANPHLQPGMGYAFYHKIKFLKDYFHFSSAIEITNPDSVSNDSNSSVGMNPLTIPEHKAISLTLKGDYVFLKDAWAGINTHLRALKLKPNKKVAPYEKYLVDPTTNKDPKEWVTEIYFPVK